MFLKSHFFLLPLFLLSSCQSNWQQGGVTYSGTLELTEYQLGVRVAGRISAINVEEGDHVKKDDVLAVLDRYDQTKKDHDRAVKLLQVGGASQQEVEQLKLAMDDQQVLSPIDGVVLLKNFENGEMVSAGAAIVVIGDNSHPWVRLFIPEGTINQIHMRDKTKIRFDGTDQIHDGHVIYIATKAEFTPRNVQTAEERTTQTFAVKVALDQFNNEAHPGVACDVVFVNGTSK